MNIDNLESLSYEECSNTNGGFLTFVFFVIYETLDDLDGSIKAAKRGA